MPLTQQTNSIDILDTRTHRFATLWEIERTDLVVFRFTDHNREILYGGQTYAPVGGFDASAQRKESALKESNVELRGIISDDAITHNDLRAGRYRDAKVTQTLVDWRFGWAVKFAEHVFWITDTTFDGEMWTAEICGLARRMKARIGDIYGRTCCHTLGDAGCGVDTDEYREINVPVAAVDTQRRIFRTGDSIIGGYAADYFNHGQVIWALGDNVGLISEVKDYTIDATQRVIELYLPTPFDITTDDTFHIIPGCDRLKATCIDTFDNLDNFMGFLEVAGTDKMLQKP